MNDEQDRLLEYLLEIHHRSDAPPTDLAKSIAQAWHDGERGSVSVRELAEVERELDKNAPQRPSWTNDPTSDVRRLRRLDTRLLVAAAALLIAVLGLWWSGGSTDVFVVAAPEVLVLRGATQTQRTTSEIAPGDAVLVFDRPVSLTTAGGAKLHAQVPTLLSFDQAEGMTRVDVTLGDLTVQTQSDPLRINVGFASIDAAPRTALSFELTRSDGDGSPDPLDLRAARRVLVDGFEDPRTLRVRVTVGEAELRRGEMVEILNATSGSFMIASHRPATIPRDSLDRFGELTDLMFGGNAFAQRDAGSLDAAMRELGELLATFEQVRAPFRRRVVEARSVSTMPRTLTSYALDFLQVDPDPEALELAQSIWGDEPGTFIHAHTVGFAERGGREFQRAIRSIVTAWVADPTSAGNPPLLPAAYLAFAGDASGSDILGLFAQVPPREVAPGWAVNEFLIACFALEALGDESAWWDGVEALAAQVRFDLDEYELIEARRLVTSLDIVTGLRAEPRPPRLGDAAQRLVIASERRALELVTRDEIEVLLETLRRR